MTLDAGTFLQTREESFGVGRALLTFVPTTKGLKFPYRTNGAGIFDWVRLITSFATAPVGLPCIPFARFLKVC